MPQQHMFFCEIFNVWGIDFMVSFNVSFGFIYILFSINHVSKRLKVIPTRINDSKFVAKIIKSNFICRLGP